MFASKTPRDLNHDPEPFEDVDDYRHPTRDSLAWVCCPRPEFDHVQHNPPNPILSAFRTNDDTRDPLAWLDYSESAYRGPREHVEHARRVLTRLAGLTEGAAS